MTARAARSTIASLALWALARSHHARPRRAQAPYFRDGSAATLDEVFARHVLPLSPDTIADRLDAGQTSALRDFLLSIDGTTATFPSDTDGFLDRLTP
jgi:hypothetical protein